MSEEVYDSDGFLITEPEVIEKLKKENEINEKKRTRTTKYNSDDDRHEAIKAQKRCWYSRNSDKQKLKSLKSYYVKQLNKQDLKPEIKSKYENKLNEINEKLKINLI